MCCAGEFDYLILVVGTDHHGSKSTLMLVHGIKVEFQTLAF
jgi:hypothetical protein